MLIIVSMTQYLPSQCSAYSPICETNKYPISIHCLMETDYDKLVKTCGLVQYRIDSNNTHWNDVLVTQATKVVVVGIEREIKEVEIYKIQ